MPSNNTHVLVAEVEEGVELDTAVRELACNV